MALVHRFGALVQRFGSTVGTALLAAVATEAGAATVAPAADVQSVNERVAAIRAKAVELSAAGVHDPAAASFDGPAQLVAWNDWKNG